MKVYFGLLALTLFLQTCQTPSTNFQEIPADKLFSLLPSQRTNIDFINALDTNQVLDIEAFPSYLQGGGVAIGDINNDGLPDIYLTSNQNANQLYLNLGNFQFKNITKTAGVGGSKNWSAGVSMADINGDGLLDIYVCNSGLMGNRANELFIHQGFDGEGMPIFAEKAHEFNLDDAGFSKQAVFFDYDNDGDLDLYLLNEFLEKYKSRTCKLYENNQNYFKDITQKVGLGNHYGTSVCISDINKDNFLDIYVSGNTKNNDFLFINNQQNIFIESLKNFTDELKLSNKNIDIADLNNDAQPDIFISEINKFSAQDTDKQVFRNLLYLNEQENFKEISHFSNLQIDHLSLSPLVIDLNNDGLKDIFMTNGVLKYSLNTIFDSLKNKKIILKEIIKIIESQKNANIVFANYNNLNFTNKTQDWGLSYNSFSNGFAYGDLDNDGDLDLVINNFNQPVFIYRNESEKFTNNNYLKIRLIGEDKNTYGIGAKVVVKIKQKVLFSEQIPNRGFLSSVEPVLNLGLGEYDFLDTIHVLWADGRYQTVTNLKANQFVTFEQKNSLSNKTIPIKNLSKKFIFEDITKTININFKHQENDFEDREREAFLPFVLSKESPCLAVGDVNNDGLEDFFVGNAKNASSKLFLQVSDGKFVESKQKAFEQDKIYEDTDAVFFDADNDQDLDLFVVSGSHEFEETSDFLQDRLYLNDGKGNFEKSKNQIPNDFQNSSCVKVADIDKDNDLDLLVLGRSVPFFYGLPAENRLLINDGKGNFTDKIKEIAPDFYQMAMFQDAVLVDYDKDKDLDLVAVGDWTSILFFRNDNGIFQNATQLFGLEKMQGFWQSILADDLDNDGDIDFLVGNYGQNFSLKTSDDRPITAFVKDFEENGIVEQILGSYHKNLIYPIENIEKISAHIGFIQGKEFGDIETLFGEENLQNAFILEAKTFNTILLENKKGEFEVKNLPKEAQFSPVQHILAQDFDGDNIKDLILAGTYSKSYFDYSDDQHSIFLKGKGNNEYEYIPKLGIGLEIQKNIRDLKTLKNNIMISAYNNQKIQFFRLLKDAKNIKP